MADVDGLYKRAEEAFGRKNYDYARDLFLNILSVDPDHDKARKSLYLTCMNKLREQGGRNKFTAVIFKGKIQAQLAATKDPMRKADLAQKYLCDDPNDAKVRAVLAQALSDTGHIIGSGSEAELALNADGKNVVAAKLLVASFIHQGKVGEAQKILDRVAAQAGEDREIMKLQRDLAAKQTMKAGFEDAQTYRDVIKDKGLASQLEASHHLIQSDEQFQQFVDQLKEEMSTNPTDARIPKKIGDLYFEKRKDYNEAREWYKRAAALAPQDSTLRDKADDCSIKMYDEQIDTATKAADPKLNALKVDRLKFVIHSFERRVQDRPTDMTLHFELGKAYYTAGPSFLDKAIGEFQQSVKDPKRKMESHIFLGHGFRKKKNYAMADRQYEMAEQSGVLREALQLDIWYNRALCNYEAGRKDEAIALGNRIIEVDITYRDINQILEKWQAGGAPAAGA